MEELAARGKKFEASSTAAADLVPVPIGQQTAVAHRPPRNETIRGLYPRVRVPGVFYASLM